MTGGWRVGISNPVRTPFGRRRRLPRRQPSIVPWG
jgi:hypothetical protein